MDGVGGNKASDWRRLGDELMKNTPTENQRHQNQQNYCMIAATKKCTVAPSEVFLI